MGSTNRAVSLARRFVDRPGTFASALLLLATKNRRHRGCVHDSKILIAVVEDRVRALDALLLQIGEPFGDRLELPFRIQIFEALRGRNVAFEPVLAVIAMKANIDLVACSLDSWSACGK